MAAGRQPMQPMSDYRSTERRPSYHEGVFIFDLTADGRDQGRGAALGSLEDERVFGNERVEPARQLDRTATM